MATKSTIVPCIILSRPNNDGTFSIKFKITNGNRVAYITTRYCIERNQWNGNMVVRHPKAFEINAKISQMLNEYQRRLEELDPQANMTASQIKKRLELSDDGGYDDGNGNYSGDLVAFTEKFIEKLKADNRTSYATNMIYTLKAVINCFGRSVRFKDINLGAIEQFEKFLRNAGQSETTINIRMSHLKAVINNAITCGMAEYKLFPFRGYVMPQTNVRDLCISKEELVMLRNAKFNGAAMRTYEVARDMFMLSFYCAGMNLTDLLSANFNMNNKILTFIRKKTAAKKRGANKEVSITIQPEACEIINKYIGADGKLDLGRKYSYDYFRTYITKALVRIGKKLGFEKRLVFYSARKTFCQFGYELGVPLYVLEYAIGHTIKDASNRPIYNYIKIMRSQADNAIRTIIDYSLDANNTI